MNEYRFNSWCMRGRISLRSDGVFCETRTYAGTWTSETPYRLIEPYPSSLRLVTPAARFLAVIFGLLPVLGALSLMILWGRHSRADGTLLIGLFVVSLPVSCVGLLYARRIWYTEWVVFPTKLNNHRIAYTRNGPDAEAFAEFTTELIGRINSVQVAAVQRSGV
jgi:hypothetical protein